MKNFDLRGLGGRAGSVLIAIYLVGACRTPTSSNLRNDIDQQQTAKHLVIAHGGYNSCGYIPNENAGKDDPKFFPDIFSSTLYYYTVKPCDPSKTQCRKELQWAKVGLQDAIKGELKDHEISWIVSCYDMNRQVSYVTSNDPQLQKNGSREELWAAVESLAQDTQTVNIIGHSYGGWTAMRTALMLGESTRIAALATIDPISMANCSTFDYLNSRQGCAEFPRDITLNDRKAMAQASGVWRNYYQFTTAGGTFSKRLHSGPANTPGVIDRLVGAEHTMIDDN